MLSVTLKKCAERTTATIWRRFLPAHAWVIFTSLWVVCLHVNPSVHAFQSVQVDYSAETQSTWGDLRWGDARQIEAFVRADVLRRVPEWALQRLSQSELKIHLFGLTSLRTDSCPEISGRFDLAKKSGNQFLVEIGACLLNDLPAFKGVLAHEIFHAIHTIISPNQPRWYFEGLAQFFEVPFRGRFNPMTLKAAALTPHRSLTFNPKNLGDYRPEDYGHSLLYFRYLISQCGGMPLFWELVRGEPEKLGEQVISHVLMRFTVSRSQYGDGVPPQCQNFESSVIHFAIARFHNQETEYLKTDTHRFFLTSVGYDRGVARQTIPSLVELEAAGEWSAFWVKQIVTLPKVSEPAAFRLYYIEKQYPFRVVSEKPSAPSEWETVLIKIRPNSIPPGDL